MGDVPGLHHLEIWVADLARTRREWGWLLDRLGLVRTQTWGDGEAGGESWAVPAAEPAVVAGAHIVPGSHVVPGSAPVPGSGFVLRSDPVLGSDPVPGSDSVLGPSLVTSTTPGPYLTLTTSPNLGADVHDRRRPGLNHLALLGGSRAQVDATMVDGPAHGWFPLYPDRYPHAGGPDHYAGWLENAAGFKVEVVAEP